QALGDEASDEALALRARLAAESGDTAAAATAWTKVAERARATGDAKAEAAALAPLARLLEGALERPADAERVRTRLGEVAPGDTGLSRALAEAAGRAGQTHLAAHVWEEVASSERAPDAWLALADAAEALADRARLRRALESAIALVPPGEVRDRALARLASV